MNRRFRSLVIPIVLVVAALVACDEALLPLVQDHVDSTETGEPVPGGAGGDTNLSVPFVGAGSVTLSWTAATDDPDGVDPEDLSYRTYFSTVQPDRFDTVEEVEKNGTPGSEWTMNVTSLSASGLSVLTEYTFNVLVQDLAGNKAAYGPVQRTTTDDTTDPTPGGNGNLGVGSGTTDSLTVTWTAATDDVSTAAVLEYLVYYSDSDNIRTLVDVDANGTAFGSYQAAVTSVTVTGLSDLTTYYFNVVVRDDAGNRAAYDGEDAWGTTEKIPRIYWTEPGNGLIRKAPLDNSENGVTVISDTLARDLVLDIGARRMYWTDPSDQRIYSADMDGEGMTVAADATTVILNATLPYGIALDPGDPTDPDDGTLFWTDMLNKIYRAPANTVGGDASVDFLFLDNTSPGSVSNPRGLALDLAAPTPSLYWIEREAGGSPGYGRIARVDANVVPAVSVDTIEASTTYTPFPQFIAVDPGSSRIYYSDGDQLDGGGPVTERVAWIGYSSGASNLRSGTNFAPKGIAVSGTTIYWVDQVDNRIYKTPVTATGGLPPAGEHMDAITLTDSPSGIAIDD
jgi:hypothetical protein